MSPSMMISSDPDLSSRRRLQSRWETPPRQPEPEVALGTKTPAGRVSEYPWISWGCLNSKVSTRYVTIDTSGIPRNAML